MTTLKVKELIFSYDESFTMKDIFVDFSSHKIHVLLGLNGSGKTTLIRLLAGLLKPEKGEVLLNDKSIHAYTFHERSKLIAYVPQNINLGDDHYVIDYLTFGTLNTLKWYESPSKKLFALVEEKAKQLSVDHLLYKKMDELSGGQRQMILICKALIQDTDIIILDEPTSSLDFKNQTLVLEMIKNIASLEDKTIILSTHNPNNALYLDSNVVLVHEGQIIKNGLATAIVNIEELQSVFGDNLEYSVNLNYNEISFKQ